MATKKTRASDTIYVATESFTTTLSNGAEVQVRAGETRVRDGHEILEGRASYFKELDVHYDLEQATTTPGTKRP